MILPKDIKSRHKIRDANILNMYSTGEYDQEFISKKVFLTQARVNQILKANSKLLLDNINWEKIKRIHVIKNDMNKPEFKSQLLSKKDALELLRKEYEGDQQINVVTQFLQVENPPVLSENNRLKNVTQTNHE